MAHVGTVRYSTKFFALKSVLEKSTLDTSHVFARTFVSSSPTCLSFNSFVNDVGKDKAHWKGSAECYVLEGFFFLWRVFFW